jgi:hypothetical protein
MNTLSIPTDEGEIIISEHELPSITAADLDQLRISRSELQRIFAQGVELMRTRGDRPDRHWVRPCAYEALAGRWAVKLVPHSDWD